MLNTWNISSPVCVNYDSGEPAMDISLKCSGVAQDLFSDFNHLTYVDTTTKYECVFVWSEFLVVKCDF